MSESHANWLSIREYAAYYNLHRNTVQKWLAAGLLVSWQTKHTVRIKRQPPFTRRPGGPQPTS